MKTFRALSFAIFAAVVHVAVAVYSDVIKSSEWGIQWLWDEAAQGRFWYDLKSDWPPGEASWPAFLKDHGTSIVEDH